MHSYYHLLSNCWYQIIFTKSYLWSEVSINGEEILHFCWVSTMVPRPKVVQNVFIFMFLYVFCILFAVKYIHFYWLFNCKIIFPWCNKDQVIPRVASYDNIITSLLVITLSQRSDTICNLEAKRPTWATCFIRDPVNIGFLAQYWPYSGSLNSPNMTVCIGPAQFCTPKIKWSRRAY